MKTACITGITGQLGSVLAEKLLNEGYKVYGLRRRSSVFNTERIDHILKDPHVDNKLELVYGDLSDYGSIVNFVGDIKPDEFYNCAAQSHVRVSFEIPEYTMDITGNGVVRCLEAIRKFSPKTRFVTCSSSEMFGGAPAPQNELTPFQPKSIYAAAKVAGYYSTINYREAYGLFAANAIMFNYESKYRGETFVTRKITRAIGRIIHGLQNKLYLGNLDAIRDWSHVDDTSNAVLKIMRADSPDDYVIGSGESHSVKEFLELAFLKVGIINWKDFIGFDERYLRPTEVDHLLCDASKIKNKLGWQPKYTFDQLVDEMVKHDLKLAKEEALVLESRK